MTEAEFHDEHDRKPKHTFRWLALGTLFVAVFAIESRPPRLRPMPPCFRNLKMLGVALHSYHEDYGCFPPAIVKSGEGQRMHSWRVLVLPYLAELHERDARFLKAHRYSSGFWNSWDFREREKTARKKAEQIKAVLNAYDLNEPWNGPDNQPLSEMTLDAFRCNHGGSHATTDYLGVTGARTVWPKRGVTRFDDLLDGATNTILVVEVFGSDILWSEPRDLDFESMSFAVNDSSGSGIKGPFSDGANVLLADGGVRHLPSDVEVTDVRALLTINDQE